MTENRLMHHLPILLRYPRDKKKGRDLIRLN
uniref:Uncharacterized protein n=1 Tax=Anguilla anguilla TaxID=7936 RepID=A0A0E9Q8H7_ANGAN